MRRGFKTKESWKALRQVALHSFIDCRKKNPHWSLEDLFKHMGVPSTTLFIDLAGKAGFDSRSQPVGYGQAAYGTSPYGRNREVSDGVRAVRRRVTSVGQMYYRGRRYNLGIMSSRRGAEVLEHGKSLIVTVEGFPALTLARRS